MRSAEAGKMLGVSGSLIERAQRVKTSDPEALARIERGEITVSEALALVRRSEKSPRRERRPGTREIIAAKNRMVDGLSHIGGLTRGLLGLKTQALLPMSDAEKRTWRKIALQSAGRLRQFASSLRPPHKEKSR
jgi:hypothetical protein